MITFGGAQAIRHGDTLGVIEEGKTADLIVMDVKGPHMRPTQRLLNTVVSSGNSHDILHTIIDGKLVMKKIGSWWNWMKKRSLQMQSSI